MQSMGNGEESAGLVVKYWHTSAASEDNLYDREAQCDPPWNGGENY
jgi:hypothetical protein